jgi:hypothetical protein
MASPRAWPPFAITSSTPFSASLPECRLTGSRLGRLPHHVSLVLRGAKADSVLLDLDLCGVAASSGSACAQRTGTPSQVLPRHRLRTTGNGRLALLHHGTLEHHGRGRRGDREAAPHRGPLRSLALPAQR